jgi:hypothetical protein
LVVQLLEVGPVALCWATRSNDSVADTMNNVCTPSSARRATELSP